MGSWRRIACVFAYFVATYLPHVKQGETIRLLDRKQMAQLLPAAGMFVKEHAAIQENRAATALHDRYIFVDGTACYNSGGSFKDGGANTGTTITQNIDAFAALKATYEELWNKAILQKIPT